MFRIVTMILLVSWSCSFGEPLTLRSDDGFILKGWLSLPKQEANLSSPPRLALFVHEYGSDHRMWKKLADGMRRWGYATLLVDLRGHGMSVERNGRKVKVHPGHFARDAKELAFSRIPDDLLRWMRLMEQRKDVDTESPVFFGSSLGGGAVLPLMEEYEPAAVVTLSPAGPDTFRSKELWESVENADTPWLIISSQKDFVRKEVLAYESRALRPTLLMLPGAGHGSQLLPASEGYIDLFLRRYLDQEAR